MLVVSISQSVDADVLSEIKTWLLTQEADDLDTDVSAVIRRWTAESSAHSMIVPDELIELFVLRFGEYITHSSKFMLNV